MSSMNCVQLQGNLTADPAYQELPGGTPVVEFSMACNEYRKGKDGAKGEEVASFIDVRVYGNQAAVVREHFRKGKEILVTGRLRQDRWEAKDGTKRSKVYIIANSVHFTRDGSGGGGNGGGRQFANSASGSDNDIPF